MLAWRLARTGLGRYNAFARELDLLYRGRLLIDGRQVFEVEGAVIGVWVDHRLGVHFYYTIVKEEHLLNV